jgi:hypothetical protein
VNSSPSSEKLCSQQIKDLIEKYKDPEEVRKFLQDAGIIDEQGDLMPPYQPVNSTEGLDPDDKSDEPQRFSRLFFCMLFEVVGVVDGEYSLVLTCPPSTGDGMPSDS